jgi:DNA helicase-2/ATP-dependent DNA helicase PcrA
MPVTYRLDPHTSGQNLHIDYAKELNPEQLAAATAPPGPALVLAGAGSGKTRTLTYRVAYLVENGIPPDRILLLTFTNKAAREMMHRASALVPQDITSLWGGTFHSIGNRLLRRNAQQVGLASDFTIMDREDTKDILAACYPALGVSPKDKMFPKPEAALDLFSFATNTYRTLSDLLSGPYSHLAPFGEELAKLQKLFSERKLKANAADYDDLLFLAVRLLTEHPDTAARYRQRWLYVLVDEYQDTNAVQSAMVDAIVAEHRNLMVVGDDAQSIYAWRGANFENILSFPERYPGAQVHRIETNYRSVQPILNLANCVIAQNSRQFPKALHAVRPGDRLPALVPLPDANQQARFIAQRVLDLREEGADLREIAVLYRAHSHAIELQMELSRRGIPFQITSGIQFFEQAHIKDVAAFLRVALNPRDEISFKRVVKLLPGIGDRAAEKLWDALAGQSDWRGAKVPPKSSAPWTQLAELMSQLRRENPQTAERLIQMVVEAMYEDYAKIKFDNFQNRMDDLRQLQEFSRQFPTASEFLAQLALMTNLDERRTRSVSQEEEMLRLSTVHQAKGLEWNTVFVMMLCDGMFPLGRCCADPDQLEEERRLFYVAVTRAKDELYLTFPLLRFGRGPSGDAFQKRSRFLEELPEETVEEWQVDTGPAFFQPSWAKRQSAEDDPFAID